ncbi:hypothetical protein I4F81_004709 [Pyropia yezoensis]|uniref:Uncharacterized protein n=1 Tax=Pyropia yezoensis TaxID=2788 RepID=A0ACC3BW60_PYRYE|nr:hypothetical protein I4F81_004709 [Neopyropia yezoensis]
MAMVNMTSYYTRTIMLVGAPGNHIHAPLGSWEGDQSSTPITVRGGTDVLLKVRIDRTCESDEGDPSSLSTLAASISLTTPTGEIRSFPTDSTWGWLIGDGARQASPEWAGPPVDGPAPPGAAWLTHPPRPNMGAVEWTALIKSLPADVCDGMPSAAAAAAAAAGVPVGSPSRAAAGSAASWGTAQLSVVATMAGLAAAAIAAAVGTAVALRRQRRAGAGGAAAGAGGTPPGKGGHRNGPHRRPSAASTAPPPPSTGAAAEAPPSPPAAASPYGGGGSPQPTGNGGGWGVPPATAPPAGPPTAGGGGWGDPTGPLGSTVSSAGLPAAHPVAGAAAAYSALYGARPFAASR